MSTTTEPRLNSQDRQFVIDVLRMLEALKRKLKELLDK
jgi:hypothetical protein